MSSNRQRREAARRHLERQLQRREQQQAARKRFTLIASIIGTVILMVIVVGVIVFVSHDGKKAPAAAGGGTGTSPAAITSAATSQAPLPLGTCKFVASGQAAKQVTVPPNTAPTKGIVLARVATTQGTLTFGLDQAKAPCAVANFLSLARQGYFDNTPCHRLTATATLSVLQCGDPTGTGSGGPGYTVNDEVTGKEKYLAGVLAMAKTSAPNSSGSQFFIVYKDSQLPPQYTIFGKVDGGLDVVKKLAAKGSDNSRGQGDGKPKLPIKITSVAIAE